HAAVAGHLVVGDLNVLVVAAAIGDGVVIGVGPHRSADRDPAADRAGVAVDDVVGDAHVVGERLRLDTAGATVGSTEGGVGLPVLQADAIDSGRVHTPRERRR